MITLNKEEIKVVKAGLISLRENYYRVFTYFNITGSEDTVRGLNAELLKIDLLLDIIESEIKKQKQT